MKKSLIIILMMALISMSFFSCMELFDESIEKVETLETSSNFSRNSSPLESLTINGALKKSLYFVGESLETDGITILANYEDGTSSPVTDFTISGFSTESVSNGRNQTIVFSYTENSVTKTCELSPLIYVAANDALTKTPVELSDYEGSVSGCTYLKFGDFPQTISSLSGDDSYSEESVYNGWYLGKDGYFYEKFDANPNTYNLPRYRYFSNGEFITQKVGYFKVESIVWRVLASNSGKKLLFAEKILNGDIPFYGSDENRTIGENIIHPNEYAYSNIRAYLNGEKNQFEKDGGEKSEYDVDWSGKGFLQKAFVKNSLDLILEKTVCGNDSLKDKVFLLSIEDAINNEYGFEGFSNNETGYESRPCYAKVTTDYAKANYASFEEHFWGDWYLRSPWGESPAFAPFDETSIFCGSETLLEDGPCDCNDRGVGIVPALWISY